ncbi:MAG TPA: DegT/DnrJ/EryC1/StrS family aminotransferase [Dehalococcoidia bacterium]|nr:DegT/DnrJ/EryC1/StrS family aminotransferase [Dehalococcoidia bacterium]
MTVVPLVDLKRQHEMVAHEVQGRMEAVLSSMRFVLGPNLEELEERFARYCGVGHAIGVGSGTEALHLALKALGIGPGDEVVTVPFTFIATVEAIALCGARPVFVDVDPRTYTMDPALLPAAITPRTRAIVPVHLYGLPADMEGVMAVARRYGLAVVEDACQAHGAEFRGRKAGSLGHLAAFSFYCSKNLGAYGDAGMVVTDDPALAHRVRLLRNHGQAERYRHELLGTTSRLDELQAAVLLAKLPHLDEWNGARRARAEDYRRLLAGAPGLALPHEPAYALHVYHLFVVRHPRRDALAQHLAGMGIGTGIHYPLPAHLQPACAHLGYRAGDFPVSEGLAREVLSLPMFPHLTTEEVEYVATAIGEWCLAQGLQAPASGPAVDVTAGD